MEWNIKIPFHRNTSERFIEVQKSDGNEIQFGKYFVTPMELIEALSHFNRKGENFDRQPLLPQNCIHFMRTADNKFFQLIISTPKMKRLVKYRTTDFHFIEVPRAIMVINVTNDGQNFRLNNSRLFAVKDEVLTKESALYVYPFPNVEKSEGTICWGSNQFNSFPCLTALNRIFDAFYDAPFGEDYGMRLLSGYPSFKQYLADNEEKAFIDNDLYPTSKVLGDLI